MQWPPVAELVTFTAAVLVIFMFVIAASGHFPAEYRKAALAGPVGTAIIVATSVVIGVTCLIALFYAWHYLPWYAAVIAAGLMILIAPYTLHPLPDAIINGRGVLLLLALAAILLDALMVNAASRW